MRCIRNSFTVVNMSTTCSCFIRSIIIDAVIKTPVRPAPLEQCTQIGPLEPN